jgi:hypothetical protein
MRAIARAEAKKQVEIAEITKELLGKKPSRSRRARAGVAKKTGYFEEDSPPGRLTPETR